MSLIAIEIALAFRIIPSIKSQMLSPKGPPPLPACRLRMSEAAAGDMLDGSADSDVIEIEFAIVRAVDPTNNGP